MGLAKKSNRFPACLSVEGLESRQLLSADLIYARPDFKPTPVRSQVPSVVEGFTPSQIRHAYGFDQVNGDGSGQTIAIVDAYRHPSIAADLAAFDLKFGIAAPPSFKVVNQTGGPDSTVKINAGWASEIAMDVEWAHAIAPNAALLLVETKSDNILDLLAGVDYARKAPGVSVVSLSWGTSEWRGQRTYDAMLTTPAGHAGVTFVAAAGDEGSGPGPEWPATSPGVLAVGGTSLHTMGENGTYASEVGWNRSTGGVSRIEKAPGYQGVLQNGGFRTSPDVAYNADPNTGFAVYSSVRDGGVVGWSVLAGTSAGAPQWAAQVAVADQLRAAVGVASLDGISGTLPALYALYNAPNTPGFATYVADFHDIVQGRSTGRQRPGAGYDEVTGLGSPDAPEIIYALVHAEGGTVATKSVAAPKTNRATAHHSRSSLNDDTATDSDTPVQPIPTVASVLKVAQSSRQAASKLSFILTGTNETYAGETYAGAARSILSQSIALQFHQPFGAFIYTAYKGLTSAEAGSGLAGTSPRTTAVIASDVAGEVAGSVESASRLVGSAIPMFWNLGQSMPMASFADAMADFAYESSALGMRVGSVNAHLRAWTVTVAMVAVDVILIGYWRAGRTIQAGRGNDRRVRFCMVPIRR